MKTADDENGRYARQLPIEGWGKATQEKVGHATVFIAGIGGLGSPVATYLAVAGVGNITICDSDIVENSNLNRQILHNDSRLGLRKTDSAEKSLRELNRWINISCVSSSIDDTSVETLVGHPDIVVDCLDNFQTRYVLNRYCVDHRIPLVHAGVEGMTGQVTFLSAPETPCLRCVFPVAPPEETVPVLGAICGVIGSIEAIEVLKYIADIDSNLKGRMLVFDGRDAAFTSAPLKKRKSCPICGTSRMKRNK